MSFRQLYPASLVVVLLGCSESKREPTATTYHAVVRPLVEANCVHCHKEGGSTPFALDAPERIPDLQYAMVRAVESRYMPPWPASSECHELAGVRTLSDEARRAFLAWRDDGFPMGDPADYRAPELPQRIDLSNPTLLVQGPEAYTPDRAITDEYRCFLAEQRFDADTFITALDIRPGVRTEVHHVQVHKIAAADIPTVVTRDAEDAAPGFLCGGGAGAPSVNMFSWRPGTEGVRFAEGDAMFVEAGSAIVLQVHYNTQFLPLDEPLVPDRTAVAFWTLPPSDMPSRIVVRFGQLAPVGPTDVNPLGLIPAGASGVIGTTTVPISIPSSVSGTYVQGEIVGMTPHMHMFGTNIRERILRADGSEECMVQVPNWDFEWQLDYPFVEPAQYGPDDRLVLECTYDNSSVNQPTLNGKRITPQDVTWGEGSFDEMCLNYVWFRYPRDAFLAARAAAKPTPTPDAGTPDAGTPDAGTPDAGMPDAGTPDAATPDAATPDAATP